MNKFVKQSFGYVQVFRILQARKLSPAATLGANKEEMKQVKNMKYITIILIFWQTIGNGFAQIEFKNDKEFEFSFTEYLCNSSGIGLDTVSAYQFEIRIWITKPDCLTRNLFRIYSQKNESNFHAQFFKLHVNPKINCVTRVEEPIIPDFVLYSIDLPQIFKNISLLQGGDS